MRTILFGAVIALSTMAAMVQAQSRSMQLSPSELRDWYRQRAQLQHEEMQREREEARKSCVLPDRSSHPLTALVSYEDEHYKTRAQFFFDPRKCKSMPPSFFSRAQ